LNELNDLPNGWSLTELKELLLNIQYGYTSPASEEPIGPRYLRITDLQNNSVNWQTVPFCQCDEVEKYGLKKGDIVIARTGATTGKSFLLKELPEAAVFASYLIRLHTSNAFPPEYLGWFMQSFDYWQQITEVSKGTAQPGANASILSKLIVPLPPLNEQRRIVSTIEQMTDRSHKARTALEDVPKLIAQFRQSVLAAAFRGDLTADWREKNPDVEPASELLERIKIEKDLADSKSSRRSPSKPQDLEMPDLKIPESWEKVLSHDLLAFVTSGSRGWAKYYSDSGDVFIRVGNLDRNTISLDLTDIQRVNISNDTEGVRSKIFSGDILVSVTADIGMIGIVDDELGEAYISQHVALARPFAGFSKDYLAWYLASHNDGYQQFQKLQRGATKTGLGLDDIRSIWIPFPSLAEQEAIVSAIKSHFRTIEKIREQYLSAQADFNILDRSILAKAFRGELVPQDPNDEPAAVLLERIRAEREQTSSNKQRGKTTRKNSSKQLSIDGIE
jgi:type I restriction enzyme, S subunit